MGAGQDAGGGIGRAIGAGAVLAGLGGDGGEDQYKEALQIARQLEQYLPEYDMRTIAAPSLENVGDVRAQTYDPVISGDVQLAGDSAQGRAGQIQALQQMQQVGQEGLPLVDRINRERMRGDVAETHQRAQNSVLANLRARGRLSGGDEIAARMIAGQQGNNLARDMGNDAAMASERNRIGGIQSAGNIAGQVRGGDVALNQGNANAMNLFTQWVSQYGTQAARDNAAAQQGAENRNVANTQRISDTNELGRYQADTSNVNRQNALRGNQWGDRMQQFGALSGALNSMGRFEDSETAAKQMAIMNIGQGVGEAGGSALDAFAMGG